MTTKTKPDTSAATPRPWKLERHRGNGLFIVSCGEMNVIAEIREYPGEEGVESDANAGILVAGANSYNPEQDEKVRELIRAADAVVGEFIEMSRRVEFTPLTIQGLAKANSEVLAMMGGDDA